MNTESSEATERFMQALIFSLIVMTGLAILANFLHKSFLDERLQQQNDLQQSTLAINHDLQHLLDNYQNTNESLAAFITASANVTDQSFQQYVKSSSLFDRLPGLESVGYVPRVPSSEIPSFEAAIRKQFPNFRVWGQQHMMSHHYPLTYSVNPKNPERPAQLRGFDYASISERSLTMSDSAVSGMSRATARHTAVKDNTNKAIIVLFSPVYGVASHTEGSSPQPERLRGFVFSIVSLYELFEHFDRGAVKKKFDMEVFDGTARHDALIYDGDRIAHHLSDDPMLPLKHEGSLDFGGRLWQLFLYQKGSTSVGDWLISQTGTILSGVMLSFLGGYIGLRLRRYYKALREDVDQAEEFSSFFENHPFAVYSLDRDRRITAANAEAVRLLGVSREGLLGVSVEAFLNPENARITREHFKQALSGKAVSYHNLVKDAEGVEIDLSVVLVPLRVDEKVAKVLAFAKNITEKKRIEQELHRSRQTLQLVLDNIPQLVFWKDSTGLYQGGNRRLLEFIDVENIQQLAGKSIWDMPWSEHAQTLLRDIELLMQSREPLLKHRELTIQADGRQLWLEISMLPLTALEGEIESILCVFDDITERKKTEVELFKRANYDSLTGLPNRTYFYHTLENILVEQLRNPRIMALMYFDIDKFKGINDTYGHDVGDKVIQEFARRVSGVLRSNDMLARLGGDEFILLLCGVPNSDAIQIVAEKIIAVMQEPFIVGELRLNVSTSIGVALFHHGLNADEWIRESDQALYAAKRAGRNGYRFASV
ncbi:diguanylate cyclase [Pseudomonas asiatica]|uniref:sensor domain-containing diguanylate cyclase n=1 Tax=Pseudomonas asiatica TaxID=2219225 RepID=UPI002E7B6D3F|nr:diguanylate cyclase [Pseudomonas asiatica]MEE1917692.1 diguanylate cyclase [Pseudomonas asiatica]